MQFERVKKLQHVQVVSESDFDQMVEALSSAKSDYEQAKNDFEETKIYAPFDGVISYTYLNQQEYIFANDPILNLQNHQMVQVILSMPSNLLSQYQDDDSWQATAIFDTYPDEEFSLKFQELSSNINPKTGTYDITFVMPKPKGKRILSGLTGHITLKGKPSESIQLNKESVLSIDNKTYLWTVTDNKVKQVEVKLNDQNNIISGVENGTVIVTAGIEELKDGMHVKEWIKERGL
ncbi:efflux RND transporter periplasmic adaptor subunit [Vibrio sp. SS-MA-C1-2]|uniref:efflux RND transporter periplasmic adaptor subunit n=1 Tax=Vibrio sp. SS-MA-C1-2 TaxID=2908646 RepID=UPI001F1EA507|nr:efflux RND transporter periplasmic adaptor subunit [Vibrio sp. SS-MA-C1-2]UJF17653.1 efflux RND transporter periplasmic adaptor subunit [Vibrio sp. SS-MA-C1-2]